MSVLFDTTISTRRYVLDKGRWEKGFVVGIITAVFAISFLYLLYSAADHHGIFRGSQVSDASLENYARSPLQPAPMTDYLAPAQLN